MRHHAFDVLLAALWCPLVLSSWVAWTERNAPLALPLLAVNTLIVALFLFRRPSREVSKGPRVWLLAAAGTGLPLLMRPTSAALSLTDLGGLGILGALSLILQGVGILGIALSLGWLGRSFGVVAANRGVVTAGPYGVVRHPLYACEIFFYCAFLIGNPSLWNLGLLAVYVALQWQRVRVEEHLLARDTGYRSYTRSVPYRLVPGVV